MWILHFLPDFLLAFLVHTIFFVGLVGTFLSFFVLNRILLLFPFIAGYYRILQWTSAILLVAGIYFEGGLQTEKIWRQKVAELEVKVKLAEEQSKQENVKIVEKVVTKTKVVKERGDEIIKYIDREIVRYDEKFAAGGQCEIPKEFIKSLNDSAERPK